MYVSLHPCSVHASVEGIMIFPIRMRNSKPIHASKKTLEVSDDYLVIGMSDANSATDGTKQQSFIKEESFSDCKFFHSK